MKYIEYISATMAALGFFGMGGAIELGTGWIPSILCMLVGGLVTWYIEKHYFIDD